MPSLGSSRIAALLIPLFLVGGFLAISAPATASTSDPTRVLIVGDSVTHGADGDYTWRYFSWKGLAQTGASVDFVGPRHDTVGGGGYADPEFDQDHEARWGRAMWQMLDTPSADNPAIADLVQAQDPDVIVETLGVNDMTWLGFDGPGMAEQVRRFVAEARTAKPGVDIVLGGIPQTWFERVADFNAALPALAAELSTGESRVVAAPVPEFTQGVDTYDIAHPTTVGQIKIAAAVSVALEQLGIGSAVTMPLPSVPGAHDPVPPTPEPTPTPAPTSEPTPSVEPQPEPSAGPVPVEEVQAVLTEARAAPAQAVAAPAPTRVLDAPSLRVKAQREGWVRLVWSRVADATGTRIWARDLSSKGRAWKQVSADVAAPKVSCRLKVKAGRVYQFKVAAVGATVSAPSDVSRVEARR